MTQAYFDQFLVKLDAIVAALDRQTEVTRDYYGWLRTVHPRTAKPERYTVHYDKGDPRSYVITPETEPEHYTHCDCGAVFPVPQKAEDGNITTCPECKTRWVGVADTGHGHWEKAK